MIQIYNETILYCLKFLKENIIIMTINEKVRNEKVQYDINRVAAKISVLS